MKELYTFCRSEILKMLRKKKKLVIFIYKTDRPKTSRH